jgi:glycosyltransferase involved in cell wall biosynthesis
MSHSLPPRLAYLVTEDWYFISHRLPMARAAHQAGFEVHVLTRVDRHGQAITAEGFHLHPVRWRRGSLDPRHLLRTIRDIRRLYRELAPDIAHHVAIVPTVVGSVSALGLPVVCLNAITGLGTIFTGDGMKLRSTRTVLAPALRWLLTRRRSAVLVQNVDDAKVIEQFGIGRARLTLIPGSGVDVDAFKPMAEPAGQITIAFVGRLLECKGVCTLVAAHAVLQRRGRRIRLLIAGLPDPGNPRSIPPDEIAAWQQMPDLIHLGFVEDIGGLWAEAHIAVLPSLREGMPLSLLEAAACGRPLIATDVPGCRAVARDGVNALLVPPNDPEKLADAIEKLADDPALRARFGAAGRALVAQEFSGARIGRDIVALYRRLLEQYI